MWCAIREAMPGLDRKNDVHPVGVPGQDDDQVVAVRPP